MRLQDNDEGEPLPIDGMVVEEFREADTVRLFMLEWRRRLYRELGEQTAAGRRKSGPGGMIDS